MDYRLVNSGDGPGIDGGITGRPFEGIPGMNYVHVDDHRRLPASKAQAGGGSVLQPKIPIPGIGFVAICQDTEGNPIGLFQSDETASY